MLRAGEGAVNDVRARRTEKLLRAALIELTVQKGFAAVTVSDLTRYAEINRATFYRHYEDKFDLVNHYVRSVYALLDGRTDVRPGARSPLAADSASKSVTTPVSPKGLVAIFDHIQANARFYRMILGPQPHGDPVFAEQIRQYIKQRIWRSLPAELQRERDTSAVDLYLHYSASASMEAVLWWLDHEMPCPAQEMAAISYQVSMTLSAMLRGQLPLGGEMKAVSNPALTQAQPPSRS